MLMGLDIWLISVSVNSKYSNKTSSKPDKLFSCVT